MRIALILAAPILCANAAATLPELSFFERAELPEATILSEEEFRERLRKNYPATISRGTGTATINVLVTPNGRAARCQIKNSSGYPVIDQWACRATVRYARFRPATNAEGKPVLGQWTERFTLTLGDPEAVQDEEPKS